MQKGRAHSPKKVNRHLWTARSEKNEDGEKTGGQLEKPEHVHEVYKDQNMLSPRGVIRGSPFLPSLILNLSTFGLST